MIEYSVLDTVWFDANDGTSTMLFIVAGALREITLWLSYVIAFTSARTAVHSRECAYVQDSVLAFCPLLFCCVHATSASVVNGVTVRYYSQDIVIYIHMFRSSTLTRARITSGSLFNTARLTYVIFISIYFHMACIARARVCVCVCIRFFASEFETSHNQFDTDYTTSV